MRRKYLKKKERKSNENEKVILAEAREEKDERKPRGSMEEWASKRIILPDIPTEDQIFVTALALRFLRLLEEEEEEEIE